MKSPSIRPEIWVQGTQGVKCAPSSTTSSRLFEATWDTHNTRIASHAPQYWLLACAPRKSLYRWAQSNSHYLFMALQRAGLVCWLDVCLCVILCMAPQRLPPNSPNDVLKYHHSDFGARHAMPRTLNKAIKSVAAIKLIYMNLSGSSRRALCVFFRWVYLCWINYLFYACIRDKPIAINVTLNFCFFFEIQSQNFLLSIFLISSVKQMQKRPINRYFWHPIIDAKTTASTLYYRTKIRQKKRRPNERNPYNVADA